MPHCVVSFMETRGQSTTFRVMLGLFVCACAIQIHAALRWGHESWQLSEWLINYAGGFVRRGLLGSLVWWISHWTGLPANLLAIGIAVVGFVWLLRWMWAHASRDFPPVLVLSCIVMGIPAYQDSIVRKDCIGLLLMIAACHLAPGGRPDWWKLLALNLLAGVAILVHEAFTFFALGALVVAARPGDDKFTFTRLCGRGLMLAPAYFVFLATVVWHGDPAHAVAVNASWLPLWAVTNPGDPGVAVPAAAINALGWTTSKGLSLGIDLLTSGIYQPAAWAMVYAITFGLMVMFSGGSGGTQAKLKIAALLVQQLVLISPLFLLGYDYGRWLFYWTGGTIILYTLGFRAAGPVESLVARVWEMFRVDHWLPRVPARYWYLLCFGVPVCWNIAAFSIASPLGRLWSYLPPW